MHAFSAPNGFTAVPMVDVRVYISSDCFSSYSTAAALSQTVLRFAQTSNHKNCDACAQVSGVIGPCALALYAINYSNVNFLTALTALFGYNLAEQLPVRTIHYLLCMN